MTLATFGKPLSKQHKQKISRALKGRGRGGKKKPTLSGHVIKGAKIGGGIWGGLGALQGAAYGGLVAGPAGAALGGLAGGALSGASGAASGAGIGAGVYGIRRSLARRRERRFSSGEENNMFMMGDFSDNAEFARKRGRKDGLSKARRAVRKGRVGESALRTARYVGLRTAGVAGGLSALGGAYIGSKWGKAVAPHYGVSPGAGGVAGGVAGALGAGTSGALQGLRNGLIIGGVAGGGSALVNKIRNRKRGRRWRR